MAGAAGVDLVQIRENDLDDQTLVDLAGRAVQVTRDTSTRIIVNDRADVALAAGAAGMHLKSTSFSVERIRPMVPPEWVIGRSVHGLDEAVRVTAAGRLDYVTYGTVFKTRVEAGWSADRSGCSRQSRRGALGAGPGDRRHDRRACAGRCSQWRRRPGGDRCVRCGRRIDGNVSCARSRDAAPRSPPPPPRMTEPDQSDFGAKLQAARERRGVSLRQIAELTRISVGALEALEANDLERLPGGIFTRAFVRSFASEVGLDPEEAVRDFLAQSETERMLAGSVYVDDTEDHGQYLSQQRVARTALWIILLSVPIAVLLLFLGWGGETEESASLANTRAGRAFGRSGRRASGGGHIAVTNCFRTTRGGAGDCCGAVDDRDLPA